MDLKCQLLLYLDQRRFLPEIKQTCLCYLEELNEKTVRKFPPLRFLLEIDVMDLLDTFPSLAISLLQEPSKWKDMCNEILFACVQSVKECHEVELAQVAVNMRFKCLPRIISPPNPRYYSGLGSFCGLLLAISKPVSYVYHTVWSCPEECEGNEVILHYIPKIPPKCNVCRSVLFENSGSRRCGEKVTATFKIDKLLSRNFTLIDDLIPKLKLGSKYTLHVEVLRKTMIVRSLEEVVSLAAPLNAPIPSQIEDLFKGCKGIPWKFIYCLSSSIGVNIAPLSCFMHVKINLLLSLTSVKAHIQTGSSIVHVLTAGYDTGYVGSLMEEGAKLAERSICLGTSNSIASTALIGSGGGVCIMSLPLHIYNQKQTSSILSSIESGEVTTELGRANLQTAVWAQGMDFKKMNLLNFASVFGTVCRGDYGEHNDEIVEFLLQNAVEPPETSREEVEALNDIKRYIDLVSGIKVTLSKGAETLLKSYFLVARKERPRGVTVNSMNALVALSLTSARLCRRSKADIDDAMFAIWLHICGGPEPRIAPEEYLQTPPDVKRLQKIMDSFKYWLEQFTGSLIS